MPHFLRNKYHAHEPIWHAQVTMLVAIVLQVSLPLQYVVGSRYLLPAIEIILILIMSITTPRERVFKSLSRRINMFLLIGLAGLANLYSLLEVAHRLLASGQVSSGRQLILSAVNIFITNIIIFGLLYWEMDAGGPGQRAAAQKHEHDLLFPQDQNEDYRHPKWQPTFIDYLYVASTSAMAFSPTDTLPLSRRAKLLMLTQSTISLVTIALIAARAVNILN